MLISEFARATGLSRDTVRFYVRLGLLQTQATEKRGGRRPYQVFFRQGCSGSQDSSGSRSHSACRSRRSLETLALRSGARAASRASAVPRYCVSNSGYGGEGLGIAGDDGLSARQDHLGRERRSRGDGGFRGVSNERSHEIDSQSRLSC